MPTLLAHEWLAPTGGSENVFEQLTSAFPRARRVCLWNDATERFGDDVAETKLARTPLRRSKPLALPFMPAAWRDVDLEDTDLVVSSSHLFAHHLAARAAAQGAGAMAYVHTPARYIWTPELDSRGTGLAARLARPYLRKLDRSALHPGVTYIANSRFVQQRIADKWGVDSEVIYPPVDVTRIQSTTDWSQRLTPHDQDLLSSLPSEFLLAASRLVPYKRIDAVIAAGGATSLPVIIAGVGPDQPRLASLAASASVPVQFVGRPSDELLLAMYQRATVFAFLAVEDFGIMPVEAAAAGAKVVVNSSGGGNESVEILRSGASANPDSSSELVEAIERAAAVDTSHAVSKACNFSNESFRNRIAHRASTIVRSRA